MYVLFIRIPPTSYWPNTRAVYPRRSPVEFNADRYSRDRVIMYYANGTAPGKTE